MKICSLSSGSKGNSLFIETQDTRILVDAGLSAMQVKTRLESIQIDPKTIDGIVLTHAHRDHVNGADAFSVQFGVPIYGHPDTLDELTYLFKKSKAIIPWSGVFSIKDLLLEPFRVPHDSHPTVGYRISSQRKTIAVCTDLGTTTREVEENITNVDCLLIESNHDPEMLINGPYPWELKERIASRVGHLSNHDTGALIKRIINGRMEKILLAHLSEENNTPDLAKATILDYIGHQAEEFIDVIEQKKVSDIFDF